MADTWKLGVTTLCYPPKEISFERALEGIARAGYKFVAPVSIPEWGEHVMPEYLSFAGINHVAQLIQSFGLQATAVFAPHSLEKPEGVEVLKSRVDLAAALGARYVDTGTIWPYRSLWDLRDQGELEEAEAAFYCHVREAADYAARSDVIIALETHTGLAATGSKALEVMKRLDHPHIRIVYDTGNVLYYDGIRPEEDLPVIVNYVSDLHLKDKRGGLHVADMTVIGEGEIDFRVIFATLKSAGFAGPLNVEGVKGNSAEATDSMLERSRKFITRVLADLDISFE